MNDYMKITVYVPVSKISGKVKLPYVAIHHLLDEKLLPEVLKITKGNKAQAARMLDMSRNTLSERCSYLGIGEWKSKSPTIKAKIDAIR